MTSHNPTDEKLIEMIEQLRPTPPRDPEAAARGRARYMAQAETFRAPVSRTPVQRRNEWLEMIASTFRRKERTKTMTTIITILVTLTLLFGGAGVTVYAAQDSLPDDTLYPVKTASEEIRLTLASGAQSKLDLLDDFNHRRVAEMQALWADGTPIPEETAARLQNQLDTALELAAGLDDAGLTQALTQIQANVQTQAQFMAQAVNAGAGDPVMIRAQEMLQEQARLAESGLADPQLFRQRMRERTRNQSGLPTLAPTVTQGAGGAGPNSTRTGEPDPGGAGPNPARTGTPEPGGGYGPGPQASQTGTPAGGYGPGPGDGECTATCTPAQDGSGPGPGPGEGQNPSQTPSGGNGSGPGDGQPNATGTPVQDGTGPGDGPHTPEPSGPGDPGPGDDGEPQQTPEPGGGSGPGGSKP